MKHSNFEPVGPRSATLGWAAATLVAASVVGACGHDWEGLSPVDSTGGGGDGAGGAPTSPASTSDTSSSTSTHATSSSTASATSSTHATATSTGQGGAGGGGGAGGAGGGFCGNGVIDPGEECDDGDHMDRGCTNCVVDCGELPSYKRPATHHCYWSIAAATWDGTSDACNGGGTQKNVTFASLTTAAEIADVGAASPFSMTMWVGAQGNSIGGRSWVDPTEPWTADDDTSAGLPPLSTRCVELVGGATPKLAYATCMTSLPFLCERKAPGETLPTP